MHATKPLEPFPQELVSGGGSDQRQVRLPPLLGKSPSFSKFRDAFEAGKAGADLSDSDSDDEGAGTGHQRPRSEIQAELEALRGNPRLQRMMMINGPRQQQQHHSLGRADGVLVGRTESSLTRTDFVGCVEVLT